MRGKTWPGARGTMYARSPVNGQTTRHRASIRSGDLPMGIAVFSSIARKRSPCRDPPAVGRDRPQKENRLFERLPQSRPVRANAVNKPGGPFGVAEEDFAARAQIWAPGPPHSGSAAAASSGQAAPARAAASLRDPRPPSPPAGRRRRCHSRAPESPAPGARNVRIPGPLPILHPDLCRSSNHSEPPLRSGSKAFCHPV